MADYERKNMNTSFTFRKGSLVFYLVLFFFAGGYLLFLSSSTWMPASLSASLQTPLGEDTEWAGRSFRIVRWDYCEEMEMMEVEMNVQNDSFDGINQYVFQAAVRSGGSPVVETVIGEPDWIILQIKEIPRSFGELSLRVDLPQATAEAETDTLKLYTNVNDVNRVSSIKKKDREGYLCGKVMLQIEEYKKQIEEKQDRMEALAAQSVEMQEEIGRLQKDTGYLTEEQKQETDSRITEIEGDIKGNMEETEKLQQEISELEERIRLAEKQIQDMEK